MCGEHPCSRTAPPCDARLARSQIPRMPTATVCINGIALQQVLVRCSRQGLHGGRQIQDSSLHRRRAWLNVPTQSLWVCGVALPASGPASAQPRSSKRRSCPARCIAACCSLPLASVEGPAICTANIKRISRTGRTRTAGSQLHQRGKHSVAKHAAAASPVFHIRLRLTLRGMFLNEAPPLHHRLPFGRQVCHAQRQLQPRQLEI